jgi:methylenetetrahydrofolate reductase (NADPH)
VVTGLCQRLVDAGVPGLHFYTLNAAASTKTICERLGV